MARLPPDAAVIADVLATRAVIEGVEEVAREVEVEATALAYQRAYDEGTYAALIRQRPRDPFTGVVLVSTGAGPAGKEALPTWLEEGTGIYGPTRRRITPRKGKFLAWKAPSSPHAAKKGKYEGYVFATSVAGRRASWVMRDAAQRVAARRGLTFANHRRFQG